MSFFFKFIQEQRAKVLKSQVVWHLWFHNLHNRYRCSFTCLVIWIISNYIKSGSISVVFTVDTDGPSLKSFNLNIFLDI